MFKAKKSKLTDSELQAKNDEAIKADEEAVSKSEKSLSQIAIDQADKRNKEEPAVAEAPKEEKPTLSEIATAPDATITPEPADLPFETNAAKSDLSNNLVNDAVKNEESRNQTSGKFEVATLPGRIGALISEKG